MSDSTRVLDVTQSTQLPGGGYLANVPVSKIEVPDNRLRELGDTEGLAASIREIGLQSPITITESGRLVAGWHRLEAVKRLGWERIPAFIVADDELVNRLIEIDENLKRQDLTVYEQSKHAAERERVLEALGQRATKNGNAGRNRPATVAGLTTTGELAKSAGMSERTWQNRTKVGRSLGPATTAVLDHADRSEEKQRNLLNSTTQLNHLADITNKRGDEVAAEVAEVALTSEGGNTFKAYDAIKNGVHFSSETPEWYTPRHIIERVERTLGAIDLDPCADPNRSIPAAEHFTKKDDGLARSWSGRVYMNPPYGSEIGPWIKKLVAEHQAGRVSAAIALVPARTDTEWFALLREYARCFIRGRLKFSGNANSAPFPSTAFYLGGDLARFVRAFEDLGDIYERVRV